MKRLTYKDAAGRWVIACNRFWHWFEHKYPAHIRGEAVDRLAAYEDILGDDYDLDRLRELAQADKEGRCVVLPCKVGEKMYDIILGELREKRVISMSMLLSKCVNHLTIHAENFRNAVMLYELQDIGKTVFLTRAEAKAALQRKQE